MLITNMEDLIQSLRKGMVIGCFVFHKMLIIMFTLLVSVLWIAFLELIYSRGI